MYIYNVTTLVAWPVHSAWLAWIEQSYVPLVLNTGCFTDYRMVQLLETDETEGPTYAIQFFADTEELYARYRQTNEQQIRQEALQKWGNQCVSFHSAMKVVH